MTQTIIGIRFSMLIPRFQKSRGIENEESRNTWLNNRIEIFNRITAQSLKDHDVSVLLFMANSDQWVYDQLDCDKRFTPVFSDDNAIQKLYMGEVEKRVEPGDKAILMKMDSDDAIHKDYFVGVDSSINTYVVNPMGVLWNGNKGAVVEMKNHQFITVYTDTYMSPFGFFHTSVMNYPTTILDKQEPMWLTYIHGDNVANQDLMRGQELQDVDVSGFGI